jgi:hypothetical protein
MATQNREVGFGSDRIHNQLASQIRIRNSALRIHGSGSVRIFTDPEHCTAGYGIGSATRLSVCSES